MPEDPHRIANAKEAQRYVLVAAAADIGLVAALEEGGTPAELAGKLALDLRATDICLRALAEIGIAQCEDGLYGLTDAGRELAAETARGRAFAHELHLLGNWAKLPEIARTGKQAQREKNPAGINRFMKAMASRPPESVALVADALADILPPDRMIDLGGGPGLYCRAMIERGWTATLVDMENTIAHVADAYGLAAVEGLSLAPGDFMETLPGGDFELALLANIVHIYDDAKNADLIRRLADAYPSLSAVAILDFVVGVSQGAELFAVNMLVHTESGNTFDQPTMTRWLVGAGLPVVTVHDIGAHHLVVGRGDR